MHLNCPHCKNPIEVLPPEEPQEVVCPSCGSSFQLDPYATRPGATVDYERKLDRYVLLNRVGTGAFGAVWKARDTKLDRIVAVKVPRAGNLPDGRDLDRFLREARSAAQLRHPAIVSVHDVGQSDSTPFIVSDFVEGITLADLLSAAQTRRPTFRESAVLIAQLADAMQYAHDHGVVHRDVKPSNIMLETGGLLSGGLAPGEDRSHFATRPPGDQATRHLAPKLMDFGLAKRDAGEITMTIDGQVLGTPAYMSPEQAKGEAHQVDGRSDVYGLGVILYQLLTGELPFRGNTRMLLHQVLHDEPKPPRSLNDRIPRDLETICVKAMAKEAGRRYQTARDFAGDLDRWLKDEPILARPVGRIEKAWRWCLRNRAVAGLAAALAIVLTSGLVSTTWLWLSADERRKDSERAKQQADENRLLAAKTYRAARDALDQSHRKLTDDPRLQRGPLEDLRRELLRAKVEFASKFIDLKGDDPLFQSERASAYWHLGSATWKMGAPDEAVGHYQKAVELFAGLVRAYPDDPSYHADLASSHNDLGVMYHLTGRMDKAEEELTAAWRSRKALLRIHPQVEQYQVELVQTLVNVGNVYRDTNRLRDAERAFGEALAVPKAHGRDTFQDVSGKSHIAKVHLCLGMVYHRTNDVPKAEKAYEDALAVFLSLRKEFPADAQYGLDVARAYNNLAELVRLSGRAPRAIEDLKEAQRVLEPLAKEHPTLAEARYLLGVSATNLGLCYGNLRDAARAEAAFQEALPIMEVLARENPSVVDYRADVARIQVMLGNVYYEASRNQEAEPLYQKALAVRQALAREFPSADDHQAELAACYGSLGNVYSATNRLDEAEKVFRDALTIFADLAARNPALFQYAKDLALTHINLGNVIRDKGEIEKSLASYEQAAGILQPILAKEPRRVGARNVMRNLHIDRAQALMKLGRNGEALKQWDSALELDDGRYREAIHSRRAMTHFALKQPTRALSEAEALIALDTPASYWRAACLYAEAVAVLRDDATQADRHAVRAVELLRQSFQKGHKDLTGLKNNPGLEPLRSRPDFQKLVAELEGKAKN